MRLTSYLHKGTDSVDDPQEKGIKKPCQLALTGTKQKTNTMNKHYFFGKGKSPPTASGGSIETYKKHSTLSIKWMLLTVSTRLSGGSDFKSENRHHRGWRIFSI